MTLDEFLKSPIRNTHLQHKDYYIYVRKAFHMIEGKITKTFDLATIDADNPGQDLFLPFISDLCSTVFKHGFNVIYVESVVTPWFGDYLTRLGFQAIDQGGINSYYAVLEDNG